MDWGHGSSGRTPPNKCWTLSPICNAERKRKGKVMGRKRKEEKDTDWYFEVSLNH
jgi:hypothetical protein